MEAIYYGEPMPYKFKKSLFLAGPSLRVGQEGESWRKDALQILNDIGFDGIVFIPENRNGRLDEKHNYEETVSWEEENLNVADYILFWVPRKMDTLPALTTNCEWETFASGGKCVLGYPEDAEKMNYLHRYAEKYHIPISHTLTETIHSALELIGEGAERSLGERFVPIQLWRTSLFQNWYKSLLKAGHRLEKLKVEHNITLKNKQIVISMFHPTVYLPKQDKFKDDEVVVSRFDIASICLWKEIENDPNNDVELVLVREFRSPVRNTSGLVHELPGGAVDHGEIPREAILRETLEEIGLKLEDERLLYIGQRQMSATLLSHSSYLYSYHLNNEELEWLRAHQDVPFGKKEEGEKTFIEVVKLSQLNNNDWVDFTTLGMVRAAISKL